MAPYDIVTSFGVLGANVFYVLLGFAFGFILESTGFGDARRLAGQFYFTNLAVLKMMFTAIVVAMLLIFWASALGMLDFDRTWVRLTYLWPGVVGGFVMGIGFIVGGYCPGTSLVSMATLKLDGTFFLFGIFFGVFLFGETVGYFTTFWNSSYFARLTLPDLLSVDPGLVVFLIVCLALVMFWGAEKIRSMVHGKGVDDR